MPRIILETNLVPHGYWNYVDAASGTAFKEATPEALLKKVRDFKLANGLTFDQGEFIENVCDHSAPGLCVEADTPSMMRRAQRFAQSMAAWAGSGFEMASAEVLEKRRSVCNSCPHWTGPRGGTLMQGGCKICGCKGIKLALATEKCPSGLWT